MPDTPLFPDMGPDDLPAIVSRDIDGEPVRCECPTCCSEFNQDDGIECNGDLHCCDCVRCCERCGTRSTDEDEIQDARIATYGSGRNDTEQLCTDCSFECDDCNERWSNRIEHRVNASGNRICESCSEDYMCCEDCGATVHSNHAYSGDDGCTYCRSCYEEQSEEDEESSVIHDYGYKPDARFFYRNSAGIVHNATTGGKGLYFGIELEVDHTRGRDREEDVIEEGLDSHSALYCKHDGSLTYGFEIVSHPGTFKYWQGFDWSFTKALQRKGYRSYDTTTCGMHVHVSKAALTELDIFKLLKFFKQSRQFIHKVSRRRDGMLDRWAKIEDGTNRDMVRKVKNRPGERYSAINLCPKRTVEFRIFRGTLDAKAIKRNLAFVYTLVLYCKSAGIRKLYATDYVQWLKKDGWQHLAKEDAKALIEWVSTLEVPELTNA